MVTGRTVLLADDSPAVQKIVSLTFADEGIAVVIANNGTEALEKLQTAAPDVVLADVHMPEPNGYQICEYIKRDERFRHMSVVLLVGTFEPFNEAEARRVGADDVLTKPFQSIRDLLNKVAHLFGKGGPEETEGSESNRLSGVDAAPPPAANVAAPSVKWEQPVAQSQQQPQASIPSPQPFADPGMDDLSIESRPAAQSARPVETVAPAAQPQLKKEPAASAPNSKKSKHRHTPASPKPANSKSATAPASTAPTLAAAGVQTKPASTSFDTRAANANAADDVLLDLGDDADTTSFAPANAAADDDFFLDIGDEPPTPARPLHEPVKAYERHLSSRTAASASAPAKQFAAAGTATKEAAGNSAAATHASVSPSVEGAVRATAKAMNLEQLSPEMLDAITHRVIEQMSDKVIREIAWEVVPELADRLIKQRLDAEKLKA
ncbi:MAG: response regulator [Acidobacteriota bacterium]|nr:response regulator [Acidobacteriota bacterium]